MSQTNEHPPRDHSDPADAHQPESSSSHIPLNSVQSHPDIPSPSIAKIPHVVRIHMSSQHDEANGHTDEDTLPAAAVAASQSLECPPSDTALESPSQSPSSSCSSSSSSSKYGLYPIRWYGLFVLALLNFANSIVWICFAPIAAGAGHYYGVGDAEINVFSILFLAVFALGYVVALWSNRRFGVRRTVLAAAFIQALGAWIRVMGCKDDSSSVSGGYAITLVGQSIAALVWPAMGILPCRYAIDWFPSTQLSLATTIGVIANPVGTAMGQFLPTLFVNEEGEGIMTLLVAIAGFCTVGALLAILFPDSWEDLETIATAQEDEVQKRMTLTTTATANDPKEPIHVVSPIQLRVAPNEAYEIHRHEALAEILHGRSSAGKLQLAERRKLPWIPRMVATYPILGDCAKLMRNGNFFFLLLGYTVGVGSANAFVTLIEQLIRPVGYSQDDAGTFGALIILAGIIGSASISIIMDQGRKRIERDETSDPFMKAQRISRLYRIVLRVFMSGCIAAVTFLLLALRPNNKALLAIAFSFTGMAVMPLLPIFIILAADCAPTVPENASSGMLMMGSNYGGIAMTLLFSALIDVSPSEYESVFSPSSLTIWCVLVGLSLTIIAGYQYAPSSSPSSQHAPHGKASQVSPVNDGTPSRTARPFPKFLPKHVQHSSSQESVEMQRILVSEPTIKQSPSSAFREMITFREMINSD